ncbi:hypothetical protein JCM10212_002131 [Sporobolomyces blumeae]
MPALCHSVNRSWGIEALTIDSDHVDIFEDDEGPFTLRLKTTLVDPGTRKPYKATFEVEVIAKDLVQLEKDKKLGTSIIKAAGQVTGNIDCVGGSNSRMTVVETKLSAEAKGSPEDLTIAAGVPFIKLRSTRSISLILTADRTAYDLTMRLSFYASGSLVCGLERFHDLLYPSPAVQPCGPLKYLASHLSAPTDVCLTTTSSRSGRRSHLYANGAFLKENSPYFAKLLADHKAVVASGSIGGRRKNFAFTEVDDSDISDVPEEADEDPNEDRAGGTEDRSAHEDAAPVDDPETGAEEPANAQSSEASGYDTNAVRKGNVATPSNAARAARSRSFSATSDTKPAVKKRRLAPEIEVKPQAESGSESESESEDSHRLAERFELQKLCEHALAHVKSKVERIQDKDVLARLFLSSDSSRYVSLHDIYRRQFYKVTSRRNRDEANLLRDRVTRLTTTLPKIVVRATSAASRSSWKKGTTETGEHKLYQHAK